MSKDKKLFGPEDFDKPTPKRNWFAEHKLPTIGALVILVALVGVLCGQGLTGSSQDGGTVGGSDSTNVKIQKDSTSLSVSDSTAVKVPDTDKDNQSDDVKDTDSAKTETLKTQEITKAISVVEVKVEGSTESLANDVIAGKYANWPEREQKLGKRYKEVQSKVNEMYRNGLVK